MGYAVRHRFCIVAVSVSVSCVPHGHFARSIELLPFRQPMMSRAAPGTEDCETHSIAKNSGHTLRQEAGISIDNNDFESFKTFVTSICW